MRMMSTGIAALLVGLTAAPAWASDGMAPIEAHALLDTMAQPNQTPERALSLRHADVWLDGHPFDSTTVRIRLDLLGMPGGLAMGSSWLKDAYVRTTWNDTSLQVGRFKLPLVLEGLEATESLVTIRRPAFNDERLGFGNVREPGVMLRHRMSDSVTVEAGIFGALDAEQPLAEAVARLALRPADHLTISMSHLEGVAGVTVGSRHRTGLDAELEIGPTMWVAEAIYGQDALGQRFGWLGLAEWHLAPSWDAVAEFASWHPAGDEEQDLTLGVNWSPDDHVRLMANWVHEDHHQFEESLAIIAWRVTL